MVIPAAASAALRPLLEPAIVPGRVLGANRAVIWLEAGGECIVIERRGIGLPNGVTTTEDLPVVPAVGAPVEIGDLEIRVGFEAVSVSRWWDPHPHLPPTDVGALARGFARLDPGEVDDSGLEAALAARHRPSVAGSARSLVGCGDGLTPAGDDILAGVIATLRLVRAPDAEMLAGLLVPPVLDAAETSTTLLSRSLLRHAAAGRVALPVADLFAALTGSGDPADSFRRLLSVGHSSGPALAAGIGIGLRVLAGGNE
jgi:hypothetical protein